MTTEELLEQLEAEAQSETPVCVIDPETRTITVPPEYQLLGVENDKRVEQITFRCPKIVGDNQDLSQNYQLFINYQNANGDPDAYHVEDMEVDGDNITFSWLLEENVTKYKGSIQIAFAAIIPGDTPEDPDKNRWNTTINTDCTVLTGLKCTQQVAESNPDALVQIWAAIDELKAGGGGTVDPEQIKQAVNGYLEENPVSGMTAEQEQQLNQNTTDVADLKSAINQKGLPKGGTAGQVLAKKTNTDYDVEWTAVEGGNLSGRGWTSEQVAMLETFGQYLVYTDQKTGQSILDGLISSLRESSGGTTEPGNYTITKELTNVTIDNENDSILSETSYVANLTANEGYYIESVTITMGGENITSTAYSEGKINIDSVTGNVIIVAVGTQIDNLIKLSECTSGNERMPDGSIVTEGEMLVTPFVKVNPDTIYKTNINRNLPDESITYWQKIFAYGVDKDFKRTVQLNTNIPYGEISNVVIKEEEEWVRILFSVQNENPYFGLKGIV